jgi:hypothetical protein
LITDTTFEDTMYTPRKIKGLWTVGFLYSDGRYERVASFPSEVAAINAARRMNEATFGAGMARGSLT